MTSLANVIYEMADSKVQEPVTVDRSTFTAVMRNLLKAPPIPKAAIPRKRAVKTAAQGPVPKPFANS